MVIPAGQDPYPIVAAIQEKVTESTAEGSQEAEAEWKQASGARNQTAMTAAPAINVKPVVGGVEISVRYITRANERYQLRAKLYQAAVDLLGKAANVLPAMSHRASVNSHWVRQFRRCKIGTMLLSIPIIRMLPL